MSTAKPKLSELVSVKKAKTTEVVKVSDRDVVDILGLEGISSDDIINKVKDLFKRQLELKDDSSIADIENIRMQRSALIEGIEGLIQLRHLGEVIKNNDKQFKREDEIEILTGQLEIYKSMSENLQTQLAFFNTELLKNYHKLSQVDEELSELLEKEANGELVQVQKSQLLESQFKIKEMIGYYTTSVEEAFGTLRKATSGISELIKTERISGSRAWATDGGKGSSNATLTLSGGKGKKGKKDEEGKGESALKKLIGRVGPLSIPVPGELSSVEETYEPTIYNDKIGDTHNEE